MFFISVSTIEGSQTGEGREPSVLRLLSLIKLGVANGTFLLSVIDSPIPTYRAYCEARADQWRFGHPNLFASFETPSSIRVGLGACMWLFQLLPYFVVLQGSKTCLLHEQSFSGKVVGAKYHCD